MTREQLIERLSYFADTNNVIGASLYFVLEENGESIIRFADIEEEIQNELKSQFLEFIRDKFILNENLSYKNISEGDDRKNVVYKYDLDDKPENLNILDIILNNEEQPTFQFTNNSLSNLDGYLITIGNEQNKIALYKKHHSINLLKRDSRLFIIPDQQRFVRIGNDALALDKSFDFMMVDSSLIVLKLNILERFFGFDEVIRNQANSTIEQIEALGLIENIQSLADLVDEKTFARKLMSIRNSPVLDVPVNRVIDFVKNHPILKKKIRLNEDETKINLDTSISKKHILKLLNDDYLSSNLTELEYDTLAKDRLKDEEV
jgi:hypothetical protein